MSEQVVISFVGTSDIKSRLKRWAKEDDRSVSYIVRDILEREAQRRNGEQKQEAKSN